VLGGYQALVVEGRRKIGFDCKLDSPLLKLSGDRSLDAIRALILLDWLDKSLMDLRKRDELSAHGVIVFLERRPVASTSGLTTRMNWMMEPWYHSMVIAIGQNDQGNFTDGMTFL
jgi:hypothetical protein